MAKAATVDNEFRRNERVVALQDLVGVPVGTAGRVLLVDGLSWIRYRVLFENGVDIGSLDPRVLARPNDFERRRAELEEGAARAAQAAETVDAGDAGGEAAAAGDGAVVNGVTVPAHLLERAQRARQRLAG
jgi:hypothetical protein